MGIRGQRMIRRLRARPRMGASLALGLATALALPPSWSAVTRALAGWNVAVWTYLLLIASMMWRADHAHLRRTAMAHAEGAAMVLGSAVAATVASLAGIVFELSQVRGPDAVHPWPHVLFALSTVAGSWLLLPVLFTLTYASTWHAREPGRGLAFPQAADDWTPGYVDFAYVAFTIAVAAQTADVSITTAPMRRLVLAQSLLAFGFNTAVLALSINIAAGLL